MFTLPCVCCTVCVKEFSDAAQQATEYLCGNAPSKPKKKGGKKSSNFVAPSVPYFSFCGKEAVSKEIKDIQRSIPLAWTACRKQQGGKPQRYSSVLEKGVLKILPWGSAGKTGVGKMRKAQIVIYHHFLCFIEWISNPISSRPKLGKGRLCPTFRLHFRERHFQPPERNEPVCMLHLVDGLRSLEGEGGTREHCLCAGQNGNVLVKCVCVKVEEKKP